MALLPADASPRVIGRGPVLPDDPAPRLYFSATRLGESGAGTDLLGAQISRRQALVCNANGRIAVERIGACPMSIDGVPTDGATLSPGSVLTLKDQLVLCCVLRPPTLPPTSFPATMLGPFGASDRLGIVGEGSSAWKLRDSIAFIARTDGHVLILGESGVGKEVAARAIHALSSRARAALVARSAATIPDTLVDAELFGNVGNYPNPGMRDRPGLIGEADGATLFLDEIGELPQPMQARLLRVLDSGGEYTRLGEARNRRADFRLLAATNRGIDEMKQDFAARLKLRLTIPGLNERRDDIPLLIRHLLQRAAAGNPQVAARFFVPGDLALENPRIAPVLVERLVRHTYRLHMRELDSLLWRAILTSPEDFLSLTPDVEQELSTEPDGDDFGPDPVDVGEAAVRASLDRHAGNVTRAARELGLKNRYVLYRLMSKYGLRE
ncbi:MAG: sigma-54-dependent Fis family transcriptional regulator [Myxococcales bacterium]|nr:sigma-54-dependent Fis family transcriptional regulator [Myxococcales bacterium]MCB9533391.1 sigma-54-dependent Fis family transcriptional regulator [Myxococcales bacterium]